ncbi:hypothetical protein FHW83_001324 [Duganella sp. SG902]|uniref:DUF4124 domain-containing protein n=1 Tax=Duganella sp. SG902 TaxID=2587016 RepID=UPI00159E9B88|nr:DUF4124 domain-containing protein [Duganella sp. SG902]NVM75544.1 hypothetical protein [Duganella sp. SG902]
MPKLLTTIMLCTLPLLAQAQVYKWVDDKGVVHYSDNKFEAGEAPVKELKPNGPPSPVLPAGVTWQERDAEFRRKQQYKLLAPTYRPRELQASNCRPDARAVCR